VNTLLICQGIVLIRLAVVKLNASRKSKRELIVKSQTRAVKDLLLGKNVLAVLPTGYAEKLDFYIILVGARKYNKNKYRRP
jgi:hypothetical protein